MKLPDQGFWPDVCRAAMFVQSEANSAVDKVIQLIKGVLELPVCPLQSTGAQSKES